MVCSRPVAVVKNWFTSAIELIISLYSTAVDMQYNISDKHFSAITLTVVKFMSGSLCWKSTLLYLHKYSPGD